MDRSMSATDNNERKLAHHIHAPDTEVSVRDKFGIDLDMMVPAFSEASEYVPVIDETYLFDKETTMAILAGFSHNRRVMIQGLSWDWEINAYRTSGCAFKLALH